MSPIFALKIKGREERKKERTKQIQLKVVADLT
jgi:hypothetical protein